MKYLYIALSILPFFGFGQIEENKDGWDEYEKKMQFQKINFNKKIKFNIFEKIYFKIRRICESRKKNRKNY